MRRPERPQRQRNPLTALDLSGCPNLKGLFCNHVGITVLDISNNPLIDLLDCRDAEVEEIVLCDPAPGAALVFFLDNNRLDDEELAKIAAWEEEVDATVIFGDQRPPLTPEEPTDPEEPGEPEDPSGPTDPEDPVDPDQPTDPDKPSEPQDPAGPEKPGAGQQGGSDAGKQPEGNASSIPQTGDASEGAAQAAAALGALGAGAALSGVGMTALLRRRA